MFNVQRSFSPAFLNRVVRQHVSYPGQIAKAPSATLNSQVYVLLSTMNHSCSPAVRLETSAATGAEVPGRVKTTEARGLV